MDVLISNHARDRFYQRYAEGLGKSIKIRQAEQLIKEEVVSGLERLVKLGHFDILEKESFELFYGGSTYVLVKDGSNYVVKTTWRGR